MTESLMATIYGLSLRLGSWSLGCSGRGDGGKQWVDESWDSMKRCICRFSI